MKTKIHYLLAGLILFALPAEAQLMIKAGETTAASLSIPFDCRDLTDQVTPETGEAGAQPKVYIGNTENTTTHIGVLSAHIGSGRYRAVLTSTAVATRGVILSFGLRTASAECYAPFVMIGDGSSVRYAEAYPDFPIFMRNSANPTVGVTGQTVTCTGSIAGAAIASLAGGAAATQVGSGLYKLTLTAANMTGSWIFVICTGTGGSATSQPYTQLIFTQR